MFSFRSSGQIVPEGWYPTQSFAQWSDYYDTLPNLTYTSPRLNEPGTYDNDGYHYASTGSTFLDFDRGVFRSNLSLSASTTDLRTGTDALFAISTGNAEAGFTDGFTVSGVPNGTPVQLRFTLFLKGEGGMAGGSNESNAGISTSVDLDTEDNLYGNRPIFRSGGLTLLKAQHNGLQTDTFTYDTYAGLTGRLGFDVSNVGSVDTFLSEDPINPQGIATGPKIPYSSAFATLEAAGLTIQVLTPGATLQTDSGFSYAEDPTAIPEPGSIGFLILASAFGLSFGLLREWRMAGRREESVS